MLQREGLWKTRGVSSGTGSVGAEDWSLWGVRGCQVLLGCPRLSWMVRIHQPASQGHPRTRRDQVIHLGSVERCGCNSSRRAGQQPAAPGGGARIATPAHELCLGLQQSWTPLSSPPVSPTVLLLQLPNQECFPQSACGYWEQKHMWVITGDHSTAPVCSPQLCRKAPAGPSSAPVTRFQLFPLLQSHLWQQDPPSLNPCDSTPPRRPR